MDLNQALNLSAKNQARNNNASNLRSSASTSSLNKSTGGSQQPAVNQPSPLDLLFGNMGGDFNSAMAALNAGIAGQLDNPSSIAQINALCAQFANPKLTAAMLQLQQQQQQHLFGPSINSPASPLSLNHSLPIQSPLQSQLSQLQQSLHHNAASPSASSQSSIVQNSQQTTPHQASNPAASAANLRMNQARYQQLLTIIEEMGREIRSCYLGNKNSVERLKRGIASARILVKDCQLECERNSKNN